MSGSSYTFLDDVAIADAAFEARGASPEALFVAASAATLNVMVANPDRVEKRTRRPFRIASRDLDLLLFELLQEVIYFKDAERLLLGVDRIQIEQGEDSCAASGVLAGERLDPERHDLAVDVKAVTLHRFRVERDGQGWAAFVILDI